MANEQVPRGGANSPITTAAIGCPKTDMTSSPDLHGLQFPCYCKREINNGEGLKMANELLGIFWDNVFKKTAMWGDFLTVSPTFSFIRA